MTLKNGLIAMRAADTKNITTKQHLLGGVVDAKWLQVEVELDAKQADTQLLLHTSLLLPIQNLLHTQHLLHTQNLPHTQHLLYTQHLLLTRHLLKTNNLSGDVLLVVVRLIFLVYMLILILPQRRRMNLL